MFTARTLLAGKWPILILAALTTAVMFLNCAAWLRVALAAISLALLLFTLAFFRDPHRVAPANPKAIVAPADGTIVEIRNRPRAVFPQRRSDDGGDFSVGLRRARAARAD